MVMDIDSIIVERQNSVDKNNVPPTKFGHCNVYRVAVLYTVWYANQRGVYHFNTLIPLISKVLRSIGFEPPKTFRVIIRHVYIKQNGLIKYMDVGQTKITLTEKGLKYLLGCASLYYYDKLFTIIKQTVDQHLTVKHPLAGY